MANSEQQTKNKSTKRRIIVTLIIVIIIIILLLLKCCGTKKVEETINENVPQVTEKEEEKVGGYIEAKDKTITPELKELFEKATNEITDIKYEPIELVATQVVAGTNYKFLAIGTDNTDPTKKQKYYVTIYEDLQGDISVTNIEPVEESDETLNNKTIVVDDEKIKSMYFHVVFYDQYGNELQREVLLYGTTPSYKGYLPEGFMNWDKALKPIVGNTYYHAICKKEQHTHEEHTTPTHNKNEYGFYYDAIYSTKKDFGSPVGEVTIDAVFTDYTIPSQNRVTNNSRYAIIEVNGDLSFVNYAIEGNPQSGYTLSFNTKVGNEDNFPIKVTIDDVLRVEDFTPAQGVIDPEDLVFNPPVFDQSETIDMKYAYMRKDLCKCLYRKGTDALIIPNGFTTIRENYTDSFGKTAASLQMSSSIKSIGEGAFKKCNFSSISFPQNSQLNTIGAGAFSECKNITTLNLPNSVRILEKSSFSNCIGINELNLNTGLVEIKEYSFKECEGLTSVNIPGSVRTISMSAFDTCLNLEELTFGQSSGFLTIGYHAFYHSNLSTVTLPAHVAEITVQAFNKKNDSNYIDINVDSLNNKRWELRERESGAVLKTYNLNETDDKQQFIYGIQLYSNNDGTYVGFDYDLLQTIVTSGAEKNYYFKAIQGVQPVR